MIKKVLNVGGGSKKVPIPNYYADWEHLLLDIDPTVDPDVCMDARELSALPANQYDAIYCSHNLEHYFAHDVQKVLSGFLHVLKQDGFAEVRVPDIGAVMKEVVEKDMDIDDVLYNSEGGQFWSEMFSTDTESRSKNPALISTHIKRASPGSRSPERSNELVLPSSHPSPPATERSLS